MKFAGCHRLTGFAKKGQHTNHQKRLNIIQFCNNMDKQSVWGEGGGAKSQHTDAKVFGSEIYAANTEYNRNKLYTNEMLKLLINISRRCFLMEMC